MIDMSLRWCQYAASQTSMFPITVVSTVPCTSNAITHFPLFLAVTDCSDLADYLVTWSGVSKNRWTEYGKTGCVPGMIGKEFPKAPCWTTESEWHTPQASTLTKTSPAFRSGNGNLLEGDRSSLRLEDADLVFLWKATHVVCLTMYEASRSFESGELLFVA